MSHNELVETSNRATVECKVAINFPDASLVITTSNRATVECKVFLLELYEHTQQASNRATVECKVWFVQGTRRCNICF